LPNCLSELLYIIVQHFTVFSHKDVLQEMAGKGYCRWLLGWVGVFQGDAVGEKGIALGGIGRCS